MNDKNLIVGIDTSDDAAVYKLNDEMATIQTLDFFTPIVDDPYTFGQIAAANSLSDVYAMGGKPIVALNIACFPNCLNMNILGEILRGGADKVLEAGAVIVGGHTVQDDEPKYGLSVTGIVHPNKVLKNYGAETGDILILTKPIGLGIINTAIKAKIASKEAYEKAVKVMAYLNKYAGEIITDYNITSCTDITGFSLIGHAYEMAEPSKKTFRIFKDAIPFIKEAKEYASMGLIPAGCYENKRYLEGKYLLKNVESWMEDILFDPQTSGGLLISCKEKDYIDILTRLENLEVESAVIGRVEDFNDAYIVVE
ncbi:selenophosphate synthetase [Clostridium perfringens]|uniref:Selenide, water dikinase n=2 Tax=Clostridium perfringens TaxID=1502 RepID=A0A2X3EBL5_CLOPF|nr:selenophosphate synthetase [Clostridium perfringens]